MKEKKFKEDLSTAVLTTQFILEKQSPILFVFHYNDGFWQFSGSEENIKDEDFRTISLEEIIQLDPTVLDDQIYHPKKWHHEKMQIQNGKFLNNRPMSQKRI